MDHRAPVRGEDDWHMTDRLHAEQGKGDPFAAAMRATRMAMIITDPRLPDNPIVFANDSFLRLTGYARHEVLGRNCRFLQGPESDADAIAQIRTAVARRQDTNVDILNYRKNGSTFWNALYLSPVSNEAGELQFFFASQLDVTDRKRAESRIEADKARFEAAVAERTHELQAAMEAQETLLHEVDHRVKNNLQMISSLIVMQSRTIEDPKVKASLRTMLERIEALSTVHRRLYQSKDVSRFDVGDFVRDLVTDLVAASGNRGISTRFELDTIVIPADKATPVALIVNELVTNAIKHVYAAPGKPPRSGELLVRLADINGHFLIEVADDGDGIDDAAVAGNFGMKLIRSLARQLEATVEWKTGAPGTRVLIEIPYPETTTRPAEVST